MIVVIMIVMMMCSHSTVEEVSQNEIRITWGVGIVGHVAQTGLSCNVSDCYQDSRWGNMCQVSHMKKNHHQSQYQMINI